MVLPDPVGAATSTDSPSSRAPIAMTWNSSSGNGYCAWKRSRCDGIQSVYGRPTRPLRFPSRRAKVRRWNERGPPPREPGPGGGRPGAGGAARAPAARASALFPGRALAPPPVPSPPEPPQARRDTAPAGSTLLVDGTCDGPFTVPVDITIRGNPTATLDGGQAG